MNFQIFISILLHHYICAKFYQIETGDNKDLKKKIGDDYNRQIKGNLGEVTLKDLRTKEEIRVDRILRESPLIDAHNDLAFTIQKYEHSDVSRLHLEDLTLEDPRKSSNWSRTDIKRLRQGRVGAQFWASFVFCNGTTNSTKAALDGIEIIHQFVDKYPDTFYWADSVASIRAGFRAGKIASLIGIENGRAIGNQRNDLEYSLRALRDFYDKGVRYITLTHSCNTKWAENSKNELLDDDYYEENSNGLTTMGRKIVREMNRLGMMVDISHVSPQTMNDVLDVTKAPVIFSHSNARAVFDHHRNVPDQVLRRVKKNRGVVMVAFFSCFMVKNCKEGETASIWDVVRHVNHIRSVAGVESIGIGADFDGMDKVAQGLEDVSKYPKLLVALIKDKTFHWSDDDLKKLAGENLLRVFGEAERVKQEMMNDEDEN